jgi:hypothetical protein
LVRHAFFADVNGLLLFGRRIGDLAEISLIGGFAVGLHGHPQHPLLGQCHVQQVQCLVVPGVIVVVQLPDFFGQINLSGFQQDQIVPDLGHHAVEV